MKKKIVRVDGFHFCKYIHINACIVYMCVSVKMIDR